MIQLCEYTYRKRVLDVVKALDTVTRHQAAKMYSPVTTGSSSGDGGKINRHHLEITQGAERNLVKLLFVIIIYSEGNGNINSSQCLYKRL